MKKILVTNDDGIDAVGLTVLVEALSKHADVYVVAPMHEQSGKSHSITFMRSIKVEKRDVKGAVWARTVDGTPADCVKWALGVLEQEGIKPDFLFSGINLGYNSGLAVYYSGTIAGAREGALNGIRSIALSAGNHKATKFDYLIGILPKLMEMSEAIKPSTILNVNAPDIESWKIKGVRIAESAPYGHGVKFIFEHMGDDMWQMIGAPERRDDRVLYDMDWADAGYVAVSPLPTSLSDPVSLLKLKGESRNSDCLAVIVDAQAGSAEKLKKLEKFRWNIEKFAHCAGRMGMPVIITETHGDGPTFRDITKQLPESEMVVHIQPDAWTSPDMDKLVSYVDPERIYIAGAKTNVSLLQTAIGFKERGFEVTVLEDCCTAAKKQDHKAAIENLRDAGCVISTLETAVMEMAAYCPSSMLDAVKNILFS